MALRWGIASAGKISSDFANSMQAYPETDHKLVAVAARNLKNAQEFAKTFNIPKAYEGYKSLAEDSEIDIVYIGSLNPQHYEIAVLMLENGKHVLCEKPLTINQKQTKKLVQLAREKKLFLREAVWSRSFPVYKELAKQLKAGVIGDVKYVHVDFGFVLDNIDRVKVKELGGGCVLDLGVYVLQFQQFVFRGLKPVKFVSSGHLNEQQTDESFAAVITYEDGKIADVAASARITLTNEAIIVGTKGVIRIPYFWSPVSLVTPEKVFNFDLPKGTIRAPYNFHNSAGLCYQAEDARQCIKAGKIESEDITHEESIQLAGYMDAVRKEVGNLFPEDDLEY